MLLLGEFRKVLSETEIQTPDGGQFFARTHPLMLEMGPVHSFALIVEGSRRLVAIGLIT